MLNRTLSWSRWIHLYEFFYNMKFFNSMKFLNNQNSSGGLAELNVGGGEGAGIPPLHLNHNKDVTKW